MSGASTLLDSTLSALAVILGALSTAAGGPGRLILYTLGAIAVYLAACRYWPYTACGKCDGKGRFRSPSGKSWRPCPRCKGSSRKERLGVRVLRVLSGRSKG